MGENTKDTIKKTKRWFRIKVIIILIVVILLASILLIAISFRNSISTVLSIKKISDVPTYQMTYHGDYAFDEYLKQGADSSDELQDFITNNLANGAGKLLVGKHGCSAFFGVTPDGDFIFARNFEARESEGCILKTDATEGSRILGVSNMGWLVKEPKGKLTFTDKLNMIATPYMLMDGMNEYGLAVAVFRAGNTQYTADEGKVSIFDHTVPIVLLNRAKTVDEAISVLSEYNMGASNYPLHYMVCDSSGNSAVIEYVKGEMQVLHKEDSYQIISNFILYNNPDKEGYGSERYKNYEAVLSETKGVISIEDALQLLQKNTIPGDEQWSVVYNLTDKTISATFYNDYDKVHEYSLK